MNTTSIDIVNLIERNPISRFNQTYQSKLIEKLQSKFSDYHQQLFLSSFYCYLKYDKLNVKNCEISRIVCGKFCGKIIFKMNLNIIFVRLY